MQRLEIWGYLNLLPQGIHTGLVLYPFIGLGCPLGQPINLRPLSPLLFLTFYIVTGSNISVPVLGLFCVHPHYWLRLGCMTSHTWPFFLYTVSTPGHVTTMQHAVADDIMIALLSIFTVQQKHCLLFGLSCVAWC